MEWVNSTGGPLICTEPHIASHWMGIDGLSVPHTGKYPSDYERAGVCALRGYLEDLRIADGSALVLGDEPLQSTFFRVQDGGVAIARWVYSSTEDVDDFLVSLSGVIVDLAPVTSLGVTQGGLVLFDASLPGREAVDCWLAADLETGAYEVTTEELQDSAGSLRFIIHRFLRAI